nr:hypothetical protein GCM10020092_100160 [Actinoplanes digitatis]
MAGGVVVAYAGDLITLIVGLETLTLPLYVLVGLRRFAPRERGTTAGASAAVTFFLVSVVSTALALLGAALLYASTGALHLAELTGGAGQFAPLASVGAALLVIGFAFKVAAVPLHAWALSHLRRRTDPGGGVPLDGLEAGRRDRARGGGAAAGHRPAGGGARGADHDGRQPGGAAADPDDPPAGLVVGGTGGLHPGAAGRRRVGRAGGAGVRGVLRPAGVRGVRRGRRAARTRRRRRRPGGVPLRSAATIRGWAPRWCCPSPAWRACRRAWPGCSPR